MKTTENRPHWSAIILRVAIAAAIVLLAIRLPAIRIESTLRLSGPEVVEDEFNHPIYVDLDGPPAW